MLRSLLVRLFSFVVFGMFQLGCSPQVQPLEGITNSIGMKMLLIPKGTFTMGHLPSEVKPGALNDAPQHKVTLKQDYYLGLVEVTYAQYQKVMGKNPKQLSPWKFQQTTGKSLEDVDASNYPINCVSWD